MLAIEDQFAGVEITDDDVEQIQVVLMTLSSGELSLSEQDGFVRARPSVNSHSCVL
jgi:hypothetical protein